MSGISKKGWIRKKITENYQVLVRKFISYRLHKVPKKVSNGNIGQSSHKLMGINEFLVCHHIILPNLFTLSVVALIFTALVFGEVFNEPLGVTKRGFQYKMIEICIILYNAYLYHRIKGRRTLRPGQYFSIFKILDGKAPRERPLRESIPESSIVCRYI